MIGPDVKLLNNRELHKLQDTINHYEEFGYVLVGPVTATTDHISTIFVATMRKKEVKE